MVYADTTTYLVIILAVPSALLAGILIYRNTTKKQGPIVAVLREEAAWELRRRDDDYASGVYDIYVTVSLQNMGAKTTIRSARLTMIHKGREYHPNIEAAEPVELTVGRSVKQQYRFHLPITADLKLTDMIDKVTLILTDTNNKDYPVTFEHIPRRPLQ
ncbi:MAG TPA: hypothetical protein VHA09_02310 [Nitrososphaera sp.]|nr:hypothetical protein [Nitrososphaera sp.]